MTTPYLPGAAQAMRYACELASDSGATALDLDRARTWVAIASELRAGSQPGTPRDDAPAPAEPESVDTTSADASQVIASAMLPMPVPRPDTTYAHLTLPDGEAADTTTLDQAPAAGEMSHDAPTDEPPTDAAPADELGPLPVLASVTATLPVITDATQVIPQDPMVDEHSTCANDGMAITRQASSMGATEWQHDYTQDVYCPVPQVRASDPTYVRTRATPIVEDGTSEVSTV